MKTRMRVWLLSAMLVVVGVSPGAAVAGAGEVIIQANELTPSILIATVGERVNFLNRTGRPVHVEFGVEPDRHQVFQVSNEIWAVFHRRGSHRYAVHITHDGVRELLGVVEVAEGGGVPSLPECSGFATVMGMCLAP